MALLPNFSYQKYEEQKAFDLVPRARTPASTFSRCEVRKETPALFIFRSLGT